tara:strand:- start:11935 stop:13656 length:1722 start_codon:yes stop_codon:yes gene_type:complete
MAGKIPQQFIDQLLNTIDIVEVIGSRVSLKKAGREYQACCPFHDEKTPSFTVSPNKQFYHCFGCGAHGTAVGFLIEYERLSFPEAIEELASMAGLQIPTDTQIESGISQAPIYELLSRVEKFYKKQLREHPEKIVAVNYLRNRGLSGEIAAEFNLGFAPPGWDNLIKEFGENNKQIENLKVAGLIQNKDKKNYDRLRNRIIFPIHDGRGRAIGFGGRLLDDGKPKYLNSPETAVFQKRRELYGLYEVRQSHKKIKRIIVVEGYMDVVALAQFGIKNVVASLGTAATSEHIQKIYRLTPELVFCFDGDRAGRDAAWKALNTSLPFMKNGQQAYFLFLPDNEDPDSFIRKIGASKFKEEIKKAQPLSEFFFAKLESQIDTSNLDGLARLAEISKPLLKQIPNGAFKDMMEHALQKKIGIKLSLEDDHEQTSKVIIRKKKQVKESGNISPIRRAICLLLQYPESAKVKLPEGWDDLPYPGIDVIKMLINRINENPEATSALLVEGVSDSKLKSHLMRLAVEKIAVQDDANEQIRGILEGLIRKKVKEDRERLLYQKSPSSLSEEEKQRLRDLYNKK